MGVRLGKTDKAALSWAEQHPDEVAIVHSHAHDKEALMQLRSTNKAFFTTEATKFVENYIIGRWDKLIDSNAIDHDQLELVEVDPSTGSPDQELPEVTEESATVETPILTTNIYIFDDDETWHDVTAEDFITFVENKSSLLRLIQTFLSEYNAVPRNDHTTQLFTEVVNRPADFIDSLNERIETADFPTVEHWFHQPTAEVEEVEEAPIAEEQALIEEPSDTYVSDSAEPAEPSVEVSESTASDTYVRTRADLKAANQFQMTHVETKWLKLQDVTIPAYNPRRNAAFNDLVLALKAGAKFDPIKVRPKGDRYEVIDGARRTRATGAYAKSGEAEIFAEVYEMDDCTAHIFAGIWNHGDLRKNLPPLDLAFHLDAVKTENTWNHKELAVTYFPHLKPNTAEQRVSRMLKLTKLPEAIVDLLELEPSEDAPDADIRPLAANVAYGPISAILNTPAPPGIDAEVWLDHTVAHATDIAKDYTEGAPFKATSNYATNFRHWALWTADAIQELQKTRKATMTKLANELRTRNVLTAKQKVTQENINAYLDERREALEGERKTAAKDDATTTALLDSIETAEAQKTTLFDQRAELNDQINELQQQVATLDDQLGDIEIDIAKKKTQVEKNSSAEVATVDKKLTDLQNSANEWFNQFHGVAIRSRKIKEYRQIDGWKIPADDTLDQPPKDAFPELQEEPATG